MPYTDQQINEARTFYKNYLDKNNLTLGEHSSVLAIIAYSEANTGTKTESTPVEHTQEYLALKSSLDAKTALHEEDIKQRDYNWGELQKAKKTIENLESTIKTLSESPKPQLKDPE